MARMTETETRLGNRRMTTEPVAPTSPAQLAQTLDIDVTLPAGETRELPGMPGFPVRSLDVALDYIAHVMELGVKCVAVRIGGTPGSAKSPIYSFGPLTVSDYDGAEEDQKSATLDMIIDSHKAALKRIRERFPRGSLQLVADPYGVAPNKDGSWGVKGDNRVDIDYRRTETLLSELSIAYAEAGADAIFSLGRFAHEVAIMRRAVNSARLHSEIWSLSGITEGKTIYIYLPLKDTHGDSGQLVLPGRLNDRLLQTMIDIHEGSSVVVVKPSDHLHLLTLTNLLITNPKFLDAVLNASDTQAVAAARPNVKAALQTIREDPQGWADSVREVGICAYTVSGQYYTHSLLEAGRGHEFVAELMAELFKEIRSCAGDRFGLIFDRHASWYLTHQPDSILGLGTA
jgi:delta-aminolevulinic acid dehydratase/porphobilinogen synthase